jgi:hypothetical protein
MSKNNESIVGYVFHESVINEADMRSVKKNPNGTVRIEAVLQEASLPNRNGRIYPKNVLEEALRSGFIQEKLTTNSWAGEANHPVTKDVNRQLMVDMNNVSHIVKQTWWDPKDSNLLVGIVETAGTITGKNMAGMITENGMQCSFSMRGLGDVIKNPKGGVSVKSPLKLVCYDLVSFPSHQKAYQRKVINEATPITINQIAQYAADNSNEFKQLNEEFFQLTNDSLLLDLNENNELVIMDKKDNNNKVQGIILLNKQLNEEVNDFFNNFKF